ncbi:MAG: TadE/TadG family type IV pilus assembly protein [Candidatus Acidiferrales bacterium]
MLRATPNRSLREPGDSSIHRRGLLWSQSGQSLVEVALLTPLLLALLVGGIELGRYAYISILVGNAARAGTAYGAQSLPQSVDTSGIQAAADNDFQNNGQNVSNLTVTSSTSCGCDSGGTVTTDACNGASAGTCTSGHWVVMVTVTTSGTFNSLFSYPGIPKSITISKMSTMRVAQN